jgi:methionyl-tRNA formyltransferase
MNIVFMGTADFAVPTLDKLYNHKDFNVIAVVTAPDRLGGRGMKQNLISPVKAFSVEHNIPILQPEKLKDPFFVIKLEEFRADIFIVVAFRMLPKIVWEIPSKGTINLHGSLLPAYRGAAPINWAIIEGATTTGVTTFLINENIDTGNILLQKEVEISLEDNFESLHDRMMLIGADLVIETLHGILTEGILPCPQDNTKSSHAPKIFKSNCKIKIEDPAYKIHNFIRGLSPTPGAWLQYQDQEVKLFHSTTINFDNSRWTTIEIGKLFVYQKKLFLRCFDTPLQILLAQFPGKKRMNAPEIINGYRNQLDMIE